MTKQTYYRWVARCAGLEVDQVGQLKQLREENPRLKHLDIELTLEGVVLQEELQRSRTALPAPPVGEASASERTERVQGS